MDELKWLTRVSLLITLFSQLTWWLTTPHDAFWSVDSGAKFLQTVNFTLQSRTIPYPGRPLDTSLRFVPFTEPLIFEHDGAFYGLYNPLFIGLSALLFRGLGFAGLYLLPLFSFGAILLLTIRMVREVAPRWQPAAPLLVGLSPLLFYSMTFWEHTPGALLATASTWLLFKGMEHEEYRQRGSLLAGIGAGLAFAMRSELGLWAVATLLSAWVTWGRRIHHLWRRSALCLVGIVSVVTLFQIYEWLEFGALVRRNISINYEFLQDTGGWRSLLDSRSSILLSLFVPRWGRPAWLGAWAATALLWLLHVVRLDALSQALLTRASLVVSALMAGLLVINARVAPDSDSLVYTFPLLTLVPLHIAAPANLLSRRAQSLFRALALTVILFFLLVGATTFNNGGNQWGPRYLVATIPTLTALLLSSVDRMLVGGRLLATRLFGLALVAVVMMLSVTVGYQGVQRLRADKTVHRALIQQTRALPEAVVVTDWRPSVLLLAPIFYDKLFFLVEDQREVSAFIQQLQAQGITEFAYSSLIVNLEDDFTPRLEFTNSSVCCLREVAQRELHYPRGGIPSEIIVHYGLYRYELHSDLPYSASEVSE